MAAIIDFPEEAAIWRRRTNANRTLPKESMGKILIFDGVQYSREAREGYAEEFYAEPEPREH